jgi:hypothetical protein
MDSPSGPTQTTQTVEPWEGAKPHLQGILRQAKNLYQTDARQPWSGPTVASRAPISLQGDAMAKSMALGPMRDMALAAGDATRQAFDAPDVGNNPYVQRMKQASFDQMNRDFRRGVAPGISDQAFSHGQLGQEGHAIAYGQGLDSLANQKGQYSATTDLGAYGQGLQAQANALEFSPRAMASMGMPASVLEGIGANQRGYRQAQLNDRINLYNAKQQVPYDKLNQYAAMAYGTPWGGTSTVSGGGGSGGLLGGLGGAATGAGIAGALGLAGPPGWALAGLGGLLGAAS